MKKIVVLMVLILITVPLVSLNRFDNASSPDSWTIMMYMSDNGGEGIDEQLQEDFDDLVNSTHSSKINVLVLKKVQENETVSLYDVGESTDKIPLSSINETWDQNLSLVDHDVLNQYVNWGIDNHPAEYSMLNLWGHGSSLDGMLLEKGESFNAVDIEMGLKDIELDILGFDACTMGLIENYYQLRDTADIIIGSQMEEPIEGWPYHEMMDELDENPEMRPMDLSKVIVDSFVSWGENNSGVSSSLTAIDTSNIPYIEMNDYFRTLEGYLPYYHRDISEARNNTERYSPQPEPMDLYHFTMNVEKRINSHRLKMSGKELRAQINSSVIHHRSYESEIGSSENSKGYGFYFPDQRIPSRYHPMGFYDDGFVDWVDDFKGIEEIEEISLYLDFHGNNTISIEIEDGLDGNAEVYFIGKEIHMENSTIVGETYFDLPANLENLSIETFIYREEKLVNHTLKLGNEL
ncbi:MAG: clostripain-related cysteine peptidase [Candidatus Saliniplasma sp.]